jgi:Putative Ig domain
MRLIPLAAALLLAAITTADATTRSSANYAIINESFDGGGGMTSSAVYTQVASTGGIGGFSAVVAPSETLKSGFLGQIDYVLSLQFASPFVNSGTTQMLSALQILDDGTTQPLGSPGALWTVSSGHLPYGLTIDPSTGVIAGTSSGAGNYAFTIQITDGLGDSATQSFSGSSTETFAQWETAYQITDLPGSTPFNDGVPTLLKYLCDIDPTRPMSRSDFAALPVVNYTVSNGQTTSYLVLIYRQFAGETGLTIQLQTSADLKTWAPLVQTGQPATPPDFETTLSLDPETNDQIIEAGVRPNGLKRQFIRLNVILP